MKHKPIVTRLPQAARFYYIMRGDAKLQTCEAFGDWREAYTRAVSALATWSQIYPSDELHIWATNKAWER